MGSVASPSAELEADRGRRADRTSIENVGDAELRLTFTLLPPGYENIFRELARARTDWLNHLAADAPVGGTSPMTGSIAELGTCGTLDAHGATGCTATGRPSSSTRSTDGASRSCGESIDVGPGRPGQPSSFGPSPF